MSPGLLLVSALIALLLLLSAVSGCVVVHRVRRWGMRVEKLLWLNIESLGAASNCLRNIERHTAQAAGYQVLDTSKLKDAEVITKWKGEDDEEEAE